MDVECHDDCNVVAKNGLVVHGKEWRVRGVVVHGKIMESAWCDGAW